MFGVGFGAVNVVASLLASGGRGGSLVAGLDTTPTGVTVDSHAEEQAQEALELKDRFDRLVLITVALYDLLKEKTGITDEELIKKMQEVDMLDGRADGKIHAVTTKCPQCGRLMSARHGRCLYCGYQSPTTDPFEEVEAAAVIKDDDPASSQYPTGAASATSPAQPWGEERGDTPGAPVDAPAK